MTEYIFKIDNSINFSENKDIHRYLDGGFESNTIIKLENGLYKQIKDVKIGDLLENNILVYGIVEIDGSELNEQCIYNIENNFIHGGPNLIYKNKTNKIASTIYLDKNNKKIKRQNNKKNILYHLLTDKQIIYINNIKFYDYNACIDTFINCNNQKEK